MDWDGISLKGYEYEGLDVSIPEMRDYMIVLYKSGVTRLNRRRKRGWDSEIIEPGAITFLTRAESSEWRWNNAIEVTELFVEQAPIIKIASEVSGKDVQNVDMQSRIRIDDLALRSLMERLEYELSAGEIGGKLYVDALRNQICILLLRHYVTNVNVREWSSRERFLPSQRAILTEYIKTNIERNVSLNELAGVVNLSSFHFSRKFRAEFGCPPHVYVLRQRLEQATNLMIKNDLPLKAIATNCGFSDQSHMSRVFRYFLKTTPNEYRKQLRNR